MYKSRKESKVIFLCFNLSAHYCVKTLISILIKIKRPGWNLLWAYSNLWTTLNNLINNSTYHRFSKITLNIFLFFTVKSEKISNFILQKNHFLLKIIYINIYIFKNRLQRAQYLIYLNNVSLGYFHQSFEVEWIWISGFFYQILWY